MAQFKEIGIAHNEHSQHAAADDKDLITVQHNEHEVAGKGDDLNVAHMDMEDRATALKLAHDADPGPPIFSKSMALFVFYTLICCMCSGDNGG